MKKPGSFAFRLFSLQNIGNRISSNEKGGKYLIERMHIQHTLEPIFDMHSRVLILGTMPSVKSRQQAFYYANPQNRFWTIWERLYGVSLPNIESQRAFARNNHIALWDVLASCDIRGSEDASIRSPQPNDIAGLLEKSEIQAIFTTGKTAARLYEQLCYPKTQMPAITLLSPSPANCRYSLQDLIENYRQIQAYLK